MKFSLRLLTALLLLAISLPASGEVPEEMRFQGFLTDDAGHPLDGSFELTLRVYDREIGGVPVWYEVREIEVIDGAIDIELSANNPLDNNLLGGENDLWLTAQIDDDGEMQPRKRISSQPYAKRAQVAESLASIDPIIQAISDSGQYVTAEVLAEYATIHFVTNNYYTAGQIDTFLNNFSNAWDALTDVPEGFSDGTDNDALGALSCGNGEVAKAGPDGNWICGEDFGREYSAGDGIAIVSGVVSASLGDSIDSAEITDRSILFEDVSSNGCGDDEVMKWSITGGGWICSPTAQANIRTVVVSPEGGADHVYNGTLLKSAMSGISGNSDSNRWLVKIEPGVYDLGADKLEMKDYVDVEGSGRYATVIKGSGPDRDNQGLVIGAKQCELRQLSVQNQAATGASYSIGIYNSDWSMRIRDCYIRAFGGSAGNYGIRAEISPNGLYSLVLKDVEISATGGTSAKAIYLTDTNLEIYNSDISATGCSGGCNGIHMETVNQTLTAMVQTCNIHSNNNTILGTALITRSTTANVLSSHLDGESVDLQAAGSQTHCAAVTDESWVFYPDSCP